MHAIDTADAKAQTNDLKVVGNPDKWVLLCKASSKDGGWAKSTKAMDTLHGVVIQVSTQTPHGCAEALVFIPSCTVADIER